MVLLVWEARIFGESIRMLSKIIIQTIMFVVLFFMS